MPTEIHFPGEKVKTSHMRSWYKWFSPQHRVYGNTWLSMAWRLMWWPSKHEEQQDLNSCITWAFGYVSLNTHTWKTSLTATCAGWARGQTSKSGLALEILQGNKYSWLLILLQSIRDVRWFFVNDWAVPKEVVLPFQQTHNINLFLVDLYWALSIERGAGIGLVGVVSRTRSWVPVSAVR